MNDDCEVITRFDFLRSVEGSISDDEVNYRKENLGLSLTEAENVVKVDVLYNKLLDMRLRYGKFEDMDCDEVLNELLDLFIQALY